MDLTKISRLLSNYLRCIHGEKMFAGVSHGVSQNCNIWQLLESSKWVDNMT